MGVAVTVRVLIVDDHAPMRAGLRALLTESRRIEVVGEAGDGCEAIRLAKALRPAVVLMDISMPRLGGVEATSGIRVACPGTKVLMLSMHSSAEHIQRSLAAGASGYVLKDYAAREIIGAVLAVDGGQLYLSPALRPRSAV